MANFSVIIRTNDQSRDHVLKRKFSQTDFCRFELHLNEELVAILPDKINLSFTNSRLKRTAISTIEQIDSLAHSNFTRISTKESDELFHYLMIDDPCIQILKDHLPLELLYNLTTLCTAKIITTTASTQLIVKLVLSC